MHDGECLYPSWFEVTSISNKKEIHVCEWPDGQTPAHWGMR